MPANCYIALGSNLGDREKSLCLAIDAIRQIPGAQVRRISRFIATVPVGGPPGQSEYINAAAHLVTQLPPEELLAAFVIIEHGMGRDRLQEVRNGPRIIDLDILLYDNLCIDRPNLKIPHPRMHERLFVLKPLALIAPDVVHPVIGKPVSALLRDLEAAKGSC